MMTEKYVITDLETFLNHGGVLKKGHSSELPVELYPQIKNVTFDFKDIEDTPSIMKLNIFKRHPA